MGLDMYAFTTTEKLAGAVDFREPEAIQELHYWRKHPNLHGWMKRLYIEKGGKDEKFNLSPVTLNSVDLDWLEASLIADGLPKTEGFFFGESDGSEREDDLAFIAKARRELRSCKTVYYVAFW